MPTKKDQPTSMVPKFLIGGIKMKEKTEQQYGSATFGLLITGWHCKGSHIKGEVMRPLDHDAKPLCNLHRLHLWEHLVY